MCVTGFLTILACSRCCSGLHISECVQYRNDQVIYGFKAIWIKEAMSNIGDTCPLQ